MQIKSLRSEEFLKKHKFFKFLLPQDPESDLISRYRNKFVLIDGDKGAGKTSLKVALLSIFHQLNKFREHEFIKYKLYELVRRGFFRKSEYKDVDILELNRELYNKGLPVLEPEDYLNIDIDINNPPHAIYDTDFSALELDKEGNVLAESHDVEFSQIRMPNKKKKFKTFLPYAVIASSEDIDIENNSKADALDLSKYEWNKKQRHPGYTQLAETQYGETVAKWQRRNVDVLIYIKKRRDKFKCCFNNKKATVWGETKHRKCVKSTWEVWLYEGQRIVQKCGFNHLAPLSKAEQRLLATKPTEELILRSQIKVAKITFKGKINDYYDSSSCEGEFYADFAGFNLEEKISLRPNYTAKDIEQRFQKRNTEPPPEPPNKS